MTLLPCLLFWSGQVSAAEVTCDGDMCATEVQKGQPAPFTGQLLTKELAISLGQKADTCDVVVKREVDFAKRIERTDVTRLQQTLDLEREAHKQRNQVLVDQLKHEQAWWRQPAFVMVATAVVTIGVVVATGYALQGVN